MLSGAIRSQVDDGPAKVYKVGEGVYEEPGSHHRISENASDRDPSKSAASQKICAELDIPRARTPPRVRIEMAAGNVVVTFTLSSRRSALAVRGASRTSHRHHRPGTRRSGTCFAYSR